MKGREIEMYVPVRLSPLAARDAAMHVLRALGEEDESYRDLSLQVSLHELGVPAKADVRVPVRAHVDLRPIRWECGLKLRSATAERFFPTFSGTAVVSPGTVTGETELWLQGRYVPPLGAVGAGLDATILRGAAERSLRTFLEWLGKEVKRVADATERESAERSRQRP